MFILRKGTFVILSILILFILGAGCGWGNDRIPASGGENSGNTPAGHENSQDAGEDKTGEKTETPVLQQLTVHPVSLMLAPGETATLELSARYGDGTIRKPEADQVQFEVGDPALVKLLEGGAVTAANDAEIGAETSVEIRYGKATASVAIVIKYTLAETVTAAAEPEAIPTVTNPHSPAVVVNKQRRLPEGFEPESLVEPDVRFSFDHEDEKRLMRPVAAKALEQLFAAAEEDGIRLFAVSGYRSYARQQTLFNWYVKQHGEEEARRFSAYPGTSEHQTGLAMDISSRSAGFELEQLFGSTEEGRWVAEHAHEFGFIIRYPEGKEATTGYIYEPWHLRYVGKRIAADIHERGITLEQYFADPSAPEDAFPVTGDADD